jgi:hypothetical protein
VLEGIPGMRLDAVDAILANRNEDPVARDPIHRHETWILGDGTGLTLLANLGGPPLQVAAADSRSDEVLFSHPPALSLGSPAGDTPVWSLAWVLRPRRQ